MRAFEQPGEAEIGEHGAAILGDQHVARLHVAMNHAASVGVVQAGGNLVEELGDARVVEACIHQVGEGWATDELEDQERHAAFVLAEIVHGDHVRVVQVGRGTGLATEPLHELARRGQVL